MLMMMVVLVVGEVANESKFTECALGTGGRVTCTATGIACSDCADEK